MANNIDNDSDFLDGAGRSRKFVHVNSHNDIAGIKNNNQHTSIDNKKSNNFNKRVGSSLKYGKLNGSKSEYKPLSISDQIRIASGMNQAVLKITSYGQGTQQAMNHLSYISRNFDLVLEDQDGSLLKSREDSNELISSWESIYFSDRKNARDTLHMVLSAPPGTNRNTFKQLTREFLKEEFHGEHDYVFVQHDDTDHPHVHASICLRSIHGKKLDPRKQYINALRKNFAEKCREHGIMVEASRRFERGLSGRSSHSKLVNMREKKKVTPLVDKELLSVVKKELDLAVSVPDTGDTIRKTRNQAIKAQFYNSAKILYQEYQKKPDESKLASAHLLLNFSKNFPEEKTRSDHLKQLIQGKVELNQQKKLVSKQSEPNIKDKPIDLDLD